MEKQWKNPYTKISLHLYLFPEKTILKQNSKKTKNNEFHDFQFVQTSLAEFKSCRDINITMAPK